MLAPSLELGERGLRTRVASGPAARTAAEQVCVSQAAVPCLCHALLGFRLCKGAHWIRDPRGLECFANRVFATCYLLHDHMCRI
jgi:hypothetical protein